MIDCMKLGYEGIDNNLLVPGKAKFLVKELRLTAKASSVLANQVT